MAAADSRNLLKSTVSLLFPFPSQRTFSFVVVEGPAASILDTAPLLQVTAGTNAGKLALLDFGLVAEVPPADREAMISATIHLANRDWNGLITDFINLKFLPLNSNRYVQALALLCTDCIYCFLGHPFLPVIDWPMYASC